jgi:hypothetical protein
MDAEMVAESEADAEIDLNPMLSLEIAFLGELGTGISPSPFENNFQHHNLVHGKGKSVLPHSKSAFLTSIGRYPLLRKAEACPPPLLFPPSTLDRPPAHS